MSQPTQWDIDELRKEFKLVNGQLFEYQKYPPEGWQKVPLFNIHSAKYHTVVSQKKNLMVHRLVWMLHHNKNPNIIDHIDGDRHNNSIENLRNVTHRENMHNLEAHRKGTLPCIRKSTGENRWISCFVRNKKSVSIGPYYDKHHTYQMMMKALEHENIPIEDNKQWVQYLIEKNVIPKPLSRYIKKQPLTAWEETKDIKEWPEDPRCIVSYQTLVKRITAKWETETALAHPARVTYIKKKNQ